MTKDKEHLQWMLNRLAEVHGENRNIDYMVRMQKIIDNTELNLHLVSNFKSCSKEEMKGLPKCEKQCQLCYEYQKL